MYTYNAFVNKVIDGDTIDATVDLGFDVFIKQRFRFYGLNAPEIRTSDKEEKKKGMIVKKFVEERIKDKKIRIDVFKRKGKYGRWLAIIYYRIKEGLYYHSLNEELIENGLVEEYYGR